MQPCRIAAENLACRRGDRVLFRGLSLALEGGEALHIAGANGVGKSSLIRVLAGLLRPFAGSVERNGAIGMVDERPALDPHLPLMRALHFWSTVDAHDDAAFAAVTVRLGIASLRDVPVRYLSTGQRKRAALARLATQRVPVWLLDEPLNGLDSQGVAAVEGLAAEHCSAGGLCVIASHQPFALAGMRRLDLSEFTA